MEQLNKIKTWLSQTKSKVNYVYAIVVVVVAYAHYLIYTLQQTVEQTQKTVEVFNSGINESMMNMEERMTIDESVLRMLYDNTGSSDTLKLDSIYQELYKQR